MIFFVQKNEDTVDEYTDDDDNEDGNLSSSPQADTYILPDPSSDDRELFKELQLVLLYKLYDFPVSAFNK